jgi:hypothetical protein
LNILDIIQLSNEIDLDNRRGETTIRFSAPGDEVAEPEDAELELFAMDDVTVALRAISTREHKEKSTSRRGECSYDNETGISIPRDKRRGVRRHEINLSMDDDRVLDELSATFYGLNSGWHENEVARKQGYNVGKDEKERRPRSG